MLIELSVQNFAIVENNSLKFQEGMTCFTGETGAGKSLLLNAISLLLGSKSSRDLVRKGQDCAVVQGVFDIKDDEKRKLWLKENGFSMEEEAELLLVKREMSASSGRSRIWIQGQAATRIQLQDLLSDWIEVSGQHEFLCLNREDYLLGVVDQYAKVENDRKDFENEFLRYSQLKEMREALLAKNTDKESLLELRRFQLNELTKAQLSDDLDNEEETLRTLQKRMRASEKIKKACSSAAAHLGYSSGFSQDSSLDVLELLSKLESSLADFESLDERVKKALGLMKEARSTLWDCGAYLNEIQAELDVDPGELESAEVRLSLIHKLKRKYLCDASGLLLIFDQFQKEVHDLENFEAELERIEKEISQQKSLVWKKARELHAKREKAASSLSIKWQSGIRELGMSKAQLTLKSLLNENLNRSGCSRVQAFFSANPGTDPALLSKVASGGELSRILLALKHLVSRNREVCAYLFDEIDTGIGGEVAQTVGARLKEISKHSQVIVVTHLAQVAAVANTQFCIEKTVKKNQTSTQIRLLDTEGRHSEIARMLGSTKSKAAQSLAREMLSDLHP